MSQVPSDASALLVPPSRRGSAKRDSWLRALLLHSHDIILALDAHGAVRFETPAVSRLLGARLRERADSDTFGPVHADDRSKVVEAFAEALEHPAVPVAVECRVMRGDGSYAYVEGVAVNWLHDADVASVVVNARDVTALRLTDPLTGLANRILLCERIEELCSQVGSTFAVLTIRADRLEHVLASLTGDQIHQLFGAIAHRLRTAAGPDDLVARLDNHTFGLLSRGTGGEEGARTVASRLLRALQAPFAVGTDLIEVESRIGIAIGPLTNAPPEDYVRNAEIALDARGGATVELFDPALVARARHRRKLHAELRLALGTDELVAFYQPIIRIDSGRVEGFEALVRWKKRDGTLVPPGDFIPLAEESGLVRKVDLHVLRQSCRFVKQIRDTGLSDSIYVNVNLSAAHFSDHALPRTVFGVLDEIGLPGTALKLEVTESALMEDADVAAAAMHTLRERGVRFGLDDFGTGYSSLSYLHRFPFETLKIDRSFIRALGAEHSRPELAEAIVLLARSMGLLVVAEGVETAAQLEFLRARRCDCAQGFLFSPAVPAEAALGMLGERPFERVSAASAVHGRPGRVA